MASAKRAISAAFGGDTSLKSLERAYAQLTVLRGEAESGRLPTCWNQSRNAFQRGWVLLNAEKALREIERKIEVNFWVESA